MISITSLVHTIAVLFVVGVIFILVRRLADKIPSEPYRSVVVLVVDVAAILFLIGILLSLIGIQVFTP